MLGVVGNQTGESTGQGNSGVCSNFRFPLVVEVQGNLGSDNHNQDRNK